MNKLGIFKKLKRIHIYPKEHIDEITHEDHSLIINWRINMNTGTLKYHCLSTEAYFYWDIIATWLNDNDNSDLAIFLNSIDDIISIQKIACLSEYNNKLAEYDCSEDTIDHPEHYTSGGIETIDYMQAKCTPEEFIGYLKCNVMKYISRAGKKENLIEDLKKARWYLDKLISIKGTK